MRTVYSGRGFDRDAFGPFVNVVLALTTAERDRVLVEHAAGSERS